MARGETKIRFRSKKQLAEFKKLAKAARMSLNEFMVRGLEAHASWEDYLRRWDKVTPSPMPQSIEADSKAAWEQYRQKAAD